MQKEKFIQLVKEIHPDEEFDFSLVPEHIVKSDRIQLRCIKHNCTFEFIVRGILNKNTERYICPECERERKEQIFISNSIQRFGNHYDYSKVHYVNAVTEVTIVCNVDNCEFQITPNEHLDKRGSGGCPVCNPSKLDTETFIKRAKEVHRDKYDYSQTQYKTSNDKVCIICPEHGAFWMKPGNHITLKQGCPVCAGNAKKTTEDFIKEARKIHGDRYDYSLVKYVNSNTKVKIICPIHGVFEQTPYNHINKKCNCPYCSNRVNLTTEQFIEKARSIHGDYYDYSKVQYINSDTPVCIICPIHGEFWMKPENHISMKQKCPKCQGKHMDTEEFIRRAREIHGDRFDYSKVKYERSNKKVSIICKEHNIEFYVTPNKHLSGQGCPMCSQFYSRIVVSLLKFLDDNNIHYETEKTFNWLKCKKNMRLDVFIPEYNVAIECHGGQHFTECTKFDKSDNDFKERVKRDEMKYKLCRQNNIRVLYFAETKKEDYFLGKVFTNKDEILKEIKTGPRV